MQQQDVMQMSWGTCNEEFQFQIIRIRTSPERLLSMENEGTDWNLKHGHPSAWVVNCNLQKNPKISIFVTAHLPVTMCMMWPCEWRMSVLPFNPSRCTYMFAFFHLILTFLQPQHFHKIWPMTLTLRSRSPGFKVICDFQNMHLWY